MQDSNLMGDHKELNIDPLPDSTDRNPAPIPRMTLSAPITYHNEASSTVSTVRLPIPPTARQTSQVFRASPFMIAVLPPNQDPNGIHYGALYNNPLVKGYVREKVTRRKTLTGYERLAERQDNRRNKRHNRRQRREAPHLMLDGWSDRFEMVEEADKEVDVEEAQVCDVVRPATSRITDTLQPIPNISQPEPPTVSPSLTLPKFKILISPPPQTLHSQPPDLLDLDEEPVVMKYEGDDQAVRRLAALTPTRSVSSYISIKEWEKELEGLEWDVEEGGGNNENGAKGDDEDVTHFTGSIGQETVPEGSGLKKQEDHNEVEVVAKEGSSSKEEDELIQGTGAIVEDVKHELKDPCEEAEVHDCGGKETKAVSTHSDRLPQDGTQGLKGDTSHKAIHGEENDHIQQLETAKKDTTSATSNLPPNISEDPHSCTQNDVDAQEPHSPEPLTLNLIIEGRFPHQDPQSPTKTPEPTRPTTVSEAQPILPSEVINTRTSQTHEDIKLETPSPKVSRQRAPNWPRLELELTDLDFESG